MMLPLGNFRGIGARLVDRSDREEASQRVCRSGQTKSVTDADAELMSQFSFDRHLWDWNDLPRRSCDAEQGDQAAQSQAEYSHDPFSHLAAGRDDSLMLK